MFNHISIGVRDVARTKAFYDAALKPLGYKCLSDGETSLGYGKDAVALWIGASDKPVPADESSGLHFCFDAPSRESVAAFHKAALGRAARTTARPGCAPTTGRTTTRPSWSIRTATGSKPTAGRCDLASIRLEMALRAAPGKVWDAVRDVGAIHTRLAPDFVTNVEMDGAPAS